MDSAVLMRALLLAKDGVADNPLVQVLAGNAVDQRIYCYDLPPSFDPAAGVGVTISPEGGDSHPEITGWQVVRIKIRVWGTVRDYLRVSFAYLALRAWAHQKQNINLDSFGQIGSCLETVPSQGVTDPDTGWFTLVAFYQLTIRELEMKATQHSLTGALNGSNKTFTLPSAPDPTVLQLFLNGGLQLAGTHYTLAGSTITFVDAPEAGDNLAAWY